MNIKQLTLFFEVYGSQPEGWPTDKVEEIYELLKTNSDAISLKKEFDEMDQTLNELYLPDVDRLTQQILDRQLPQRNSNLATDLLNWIWPAHPQSGFLEAHLRSIFTTAFWNFPRKLLFIWYQLRIFRF